MTTNSETGTE